ncbi:MAG: hypothetical protein EON88_24410 [Brevundimonas sp.]|nr:MAG: hypothetical protein EON88_24410 [Brevundimonas sp.]
MRLAHALDRSDAAFFEMLDHQAGRHAVFFRTPDRQGVLADATGCRTIFYDGDAVASHVRLLSDAPPVDMPFGMGFPGNHTPIPGVRILTPNTLIDLKSHAVSRFWPREAPPVLDLDTAQARVETFAATALRKGPKFALGLTAGMDSRTVAVAAWKAGVDVLTFTYDRGSHTHEDIAVARLLAAALGLRHKTVQERKPTPKTRARLRQATYYSHHLSCIEPLAEALGRRAVASGNLLEIGRVFYARHRRHGRDLSTPEQMAGHFYDNARPAARARFDAWGHARWMAASTEAFAEFDAVTGFQSAARLIDPFDLFYWEHRMGAWQSMILLERDFYGEPYMPFNCRAIFTAMLGLTHEVREAATLFRRLIDIPELADVPLKSSSTPKAAAIVAGPVSPVA